jgi:DNA-binding GntR family transcriptional regulator
VAVLRQIPIAEQVTQELHKRILEGVYGPGERLPSESELAGELSVSRGSVRSAMASLATAGLIDRRQGDGTYVQELKNADNSLVYAIWEFNQLIKASGHKPSIQAGAIDRRSATKEEATTLRIDPGEEIISVNRLFFADDQPFIYSINVSPASLFDVPEDQLDATLGIHGFVRRFCNQEVARVDMDISATIAAGPVQEGLVLAARTPILRLEQLFLDINRHPLVLATNYLKGNKLSLHDIRPWHPWHRV